MVNSYIPESLDLYGADLARRSGLPKNKAFEIIPFADQIVNVEHSKGKNKKYMSITFKKTFEVK